MSNAKLRLYLSCCASMILATTGGCSPTSASSSPSADAGDDTPPPDGVECGSVTCAIRGGACCFEPSGPTCVDAGSSSDLAVLCRYPYLACDGPEDCPGQVCCLKQPIAAYPNATCQPQGAGAACGIGQQTVCKTASYCSSATLDNAPGCDYVPADAGLGAILQTCE